MLLEEQKVLTLLAPQHFDCLAYAQIDFKTGQIEYDEYFENKRYLGKQPLYFDLASISKPINLAASYLLEPKIFSHEMILFLEHRSGLPIWGKLGAPFWRDLILSYSSKESETAYSDIGALRCMLEIEKVSGKKIKEIIDSTWDEELCFWKDLPQNALCPISGIRQGKEIIGEVNDDNAFYIDEYVAHAGMFGTVSGLAKSFLNLFDKTNAFDKLSELFDSKPVEQRYLRGWDTTDQVKLTGEGCSKKTFGHTGFTGTCAWFDCESKKGSIVLTNGTKKYWFDRAGLNGIRKAIGTYNWS